MRLYFIALQFLTIIPLPFSVRCEARDLGRSMGLFPLVGLTLGIVLAGLNSLLSLALPRGVVDLLLVATLAVVTGVLHLDGLADTCDGLAARGGRERILAIMKDSRTGAAGAVGLVLALALKYEALLLIPVHAKTEALLYFPLIARFSQVQMTMGARSARNDGLGAVFIEGAGWTQMLIATAMALSGAVIFFGIPGLWLFISSCLLTALLRAWFRRKIGGVTGDIIGFASELNEILCLLMILVIRAQGKVFHL